LGEDVLTVVTADHGEGLGDHQEATHSLFIYDSTLRVPLIFHGPGIPRGAVIREQVRTVDILPSILDRVGKPDACSACQGKSLVGLMEGRDLEARTSYAETYFPRLNLGWSELRSLRRERWKYIAAPQPELYDIDADPGELENLAKQEPEKLAELAEALSDFEAKTLGPAGGAAVTPDRETLALLRRLGYVSSEKPPPREGPLPDPKDRLDVWQRFREGMEQVSKGKFDEAILQFERVLQQDDGLLLARSYLSGAYFERGRYQEAASQCGNLLAQDPTDFQATLLLGKSLARLGRGREAEQALQQSAELDSISAEPLAELANLYLQAGAGAKARDSLAAARQRDPDSPSVLLVQGKLLVMEGKPKEGEESFRQALSADPSEEEPRVQLANLLLGQRRLDEAENLLREGLEERPQSALLHLGLGHSKALAGNLRAGIESFQRALELDPDSTLVLNSLAFAYFEVNEAEKGIELLKRSLEKNPDQPELESFLVNLRAR
jgi:tetratricopeptide (TPR) repeat protein